MSAWRSQGASIADYLLPGLSRAEIESGFASVGLVPPREAFVWWGWHNGVAGNHQPGPGDMQLPSLAECIEHVRRERGLDSELQEAGSDPVWGPDWFCLTNSIAIATEVPDDDPSPAYLVHWHYVDVPAPPIAQSVGELVSNWIRAIEMGAWWCEGGHWTGDESMVLNRMGPRGAWGFY